MLRRNRWYLAAAGAALVFGGGIAGHAPWRASALHGFGLGFATFLIFGLGHAGVLLLVAGFLAGLSTVAFFGGAFAWAALAIFAARLAPVLMARSD